ncbi:MAG: hypothetical protein WAV55_07650 [Clostridiaceae bacterium]
MYAYCVNNPINLYDSEGYRSKSIWSLRSNAVGRGILYWYLFMRGAPFITSGGFYGKYMMNNKVLTKKVRSLILPIGKNLSNGNSININKTTTMIIDNGEDIIGYQYLHGTNSSVGGFNISGNISKDLQGNVTYNLMYTWNDLIDPNFTYNSDKLKVALAMKIPFAKPTNFYIKISWWDKTIIKAKQSFFNWNTGWLK